MSSILSYFPNSIPTAEAKIGDEKAFKIASWNTFDFGGKFGGICKANDPTAS